MILTGTQPEGEEAVYKFDAGEVKCKSATYEGTAKEAVKGTTYFTLSVKREGCTTFLGLSVTIDMNGCAYTFRVETKEGEVYEGKVDLECPTGQKVAMTLPGCVVTVPPQTKKEKVFYKNEGEKAGRKLTVEISVNSLIYEEHKSGMFSMCANETIATSNGVFKANAAVMGEDEQKAAVGIWVE